MKVHGIQCPKCKDIIYSRAGHDFRYCTCGDVFVDGGQEEYGCRTGYTKELPKSVELEVLGVADKKELRQDWNWTDRNKLGLIKGGQVDLRHKILAIGDVRFDGPTQRTAGDDNGTTSATGVPEQPKKKRYSRTARTRLVDGDQRPG